MTETEGQKKFPWGAFWIALGLLLLFRLPSLDMPLDRDEGEYATLALNWMRGLGLPYRDFLEQKPPLAILAYMAAFFAAGESALSVRLFALLWQLFSAAALFALLWRRAASARLALLAAALYAMLSASAYTQGLGANTELFVTLPLTAAVAILTYGRGREHWIAAGLMLGLAGLFKQSALPAALLLPLLAAGAWRERLERLAWCLAGAVAPWTLTLILFSLAGAAGPFWNCVFSYNLAYAGQGLKAQLGGLASALAGLSREDWALWAALAAAGFAAFKGRLPASRLFWIWLLAAGLGAAMSGRYYPHYFQVLAAPASALAAIWAFSPGRRWPRLALLGAFALVFCAKNAPLWAEPDGGARSQRLYGLPNFKNAPATAEALRARTPEGSRLLIWGSEAEIYFLSQRRPATRFLFHYPFSGEAPAWPGGEEEWLAAMEDPRCAAVALTAPLDRGDAFQRRIAASLQKNYSLRVDLAPETLIGIRKK